MKLITRDTDYAIRALCCIARRRERLVSADELVTCLEMPRPFLRKILQTLNRNGIVISHKGKGGGFSLSTSGSRVSIFDLITVFQGPLRLADHTFKKKPCPHIRTCPVKKELDRLEKVVVARLKGMTIGSLMLQNRKT